jgi:hypothetical protein
MVGRKHHAERRQHGVEAAILEGQRLGVGHLKRHVQAFRGSTLGTTVEQAGYVVGGRHPATAARGGQRGVAIAGSHIQNPLVASQVASLGEKLTDELQGRADDGVVAGLPGQLLAIFPLGEVDGLGLCCLSRLQRL